MDEDYPRSLEEIEARFTTEAACLEYLAALRGHPGVAHPSGLSALPAVRKADLGDH